MKVGLLSDLVQTLTSFLQAVVASSRVSTVTENGYAALKISPVTAFDKGEYTCVAVNTLGEARHTAVINVTGW